jgi:hypothetical protein
VGVDAIATEPAASTAKSCTPAAVEPPAVVLGRYTSTVWEFGVVRSAAVTVPTFVLDAALRMPTFAPIAIAPVTPTASMETTVMIRVRPENQPECCVVVMPSTVEVGARAGGQAKANVR